MRPTMLQLAALAAAALAATPARLLAEEEAAADPVGLLDPGGVGAIWKLVLFLLLLWVLSRFVWPHIFQGLEAREQKIRSDITGAEEANREAQQTLSQYKQQLAEAHAEARKLVDQARADGEALRSRMLADAEKEIGRLKQRATEDIQHARQQALQELYAHSADLAVAVASKILQRQIDGEDNRRLVEQSLAEMERMN